MADKKLSELALLPTSWQSTARIYLAYNGDSYGGTISDLLTLIDAFAVGAGGDLQYQIGQTIFNSAGSQQCNWGHGTQPVGARSNQAGDASNPWHQLMQQSAPTINTFAGDGTTAIFNTDHQIDVSFLVRLPSTSLVRYWIGIANDVLTNMSADDPAKDFAAFRWSTAAGDAVFRCITKDGTTANNQSSDVSKNANDWYTLGVKCVGTPLSHIQFFINGTLVAVSNQNLPRSSQTYRLFAGCETLEGALKDLRFAAFRSRTLFVT